jgi:hypothetical protein
MKIMSQARTREHPDQPLTRQRGHSRCTSGSHERPPWRGPGMLAMAIPWEKLPPVNPGMGTNRSETRRSGVSPDRYSVDRMQSEAAPVKTRIYTSKGKKSSARQTPAAPPLRSTCLFRDCSCWMSGRWLRTAAVWGTVGGCSRGRTFLRNARGAGPGGVGGIRLAEGRLARRGRGGRHPVAVAGAERGVRRESLTSERRPPARCLDRMPRINPTGHSPHQASDLSPSATCQQ